MTIDEITYDLLETVRGQVNKDDEIDLRQIEFWVHNQRALWLKNELNKTLAINTAYIQDLGKLDLEISPYEDLLNNRPEFKYLRTVRELPPFIRRFGKECIVRVGPISLNSTAFTLIDANSMPFIGNGRFNYKNIFAFLLDRRIYITFRENNTLSNVLNNLRVHGVLENPLDAENYVNPDGTPVWSRTKEYPIGRDLYNYMKAEVMKLDFKIKSTAPSDKIGDSNNDLSLSAKV